MNKTCKGCKNDFPLVSFSRAGKYYQSKCKNCLRIYSAEWRAKNAERVRYNQCKSKLKIDDDNYRRIASMKECQICKSTPKTLCIDHNHLNNKFRGALCANCNHALGKFKDNKKILLNAILYLEKYE